MTSYVNAPFPKIVFPMAKLYSLIVLAKVTENYAEFVKSNYFMSNE